MKATEKEETNFTSIVLSRLLFTSVFGSFLGYAFAESWWFWNWHWIGIVIFFLFLIIVVLFAAEEDMERVIEKHKRNN